MLARCDSGECSFAWGFNDHWKIAPRLRLTASVHSPNRATGVVLRSTAPESRARRTRRQRARNDGAMALDSSLGGRKGVSGGAIPRRPFSIAASTDFLNSSSSCCCRGAARNKVRKTNIASAAASRSANRRPAARTPRRVDGDARQRSKAAWGRRIPRPRSLPVIAGTATRPRTHHPIPASAQSELGLSSTASRRLRIEIRCRPSR